MKKFLSSILIAIPLLLVSTGLLFGQTAASATWALSSDTTVTVSGNVNATSESIMGLQAAYETPPAGTTDKVQKLKPDASTSGTSGTGSWPTETTANAGRYVEFAIAPQANLNLAVDSISMMIGNKGILGMSASIYYSTNSNFSDSVQIAQIDTVIENTVMDTTFGGLNIAVNSGQTLYVRVYPYLPVSSTSTSKYLYVGNVVVSGNTTSSLAFVSQWGFISNGGWNFISSDTAGNAGMGGSAPPTNWTGLRGGFDSLTATTSNAVVVTGKITFSGGDPTSWSALRYGLYHNNSAGVLQYPATDSAQWSGNDNSVNGYIFTPITAPGNNVSWRVGGNYTQGVIINGGWNTTNNWSGVAPAPLGNVVPAPYPASLTAGTYDFAISVQPQADGTNQLRWYLEKEDKTYWFGGTVTDTVPAPATYNEIVIGINGGNGISSTGLTGVTLTDVKAGLGTPITVPEAPFAAFYVNQWGLLSDNTGWHFIQDPDSLVGNAGMGGSAPPTNWAGLRGGFAVPVTATQSKAIIVTGKVTFSGGDPTSWSALRYGLYYNDSAGVVQNPATDSALWSGNDNMVNGYIFTPITAPGNNVGWRSGGNNTQGVIINGGWNTTNNWSGVAPVPLGNVEAAPYPASLTAGTYDFAISVQPQADGTNQLRWYLEKEDKTYWFGGTVTDTVPAPATYNEIVFGINGGNDINTTGLTGVTLTDVKVDLGAPITVPEAPFAAFYVNQWGLLSGNTGWHFVQDPDSLVGNAGMGGSAPPTNWAGLRGGFAVPVTATQSKAIIVTGKVTFSGGDPTSWSALRYGLYYNDSAGVVQNPATDSAQWSGNDNMVNGYIFTPITAPGNKVGWRVGGNNTQGVIINGGWNTTNNWSGVAPVPLGNVEAAPYPASLTAGTYDFAISVQPQADGTNQLRWYLEKEDKTYWFGGTVTDTVPAPATYNEIVFGINGGNDINTTGLTGVTLTEVKVDLGKPITVPEAPWQDFYVSMWGFYQNQTGGWLFNPGVLVGDAAMSGSNALTGWATLRGGFGAPVEARNGVDSALVIKGDLELDGGGFQSTGSLRFGLYYNDNPGNLTVISDTVNSVVYDSTRWTGSNATESGYLFIPVSGSNSAVAWGTTSGTFGSVINGAWDSTTTGYVLGNDKAMPLLAAGGAGNYSFSISVAPAGNGKQLVAYELKKSDQSYMISGTTLDDHNPLPTTKFNGIVFGLGPGNTTTALKLTNVQVTLDTPLVVTAVANNDNSSLPKTYDLSQNYPNPFNPSTTIKFALPKSGDVSLVVYDILGREVTTLVHGNLAAGYHTVDFNASDLASGVYFYRLKAGNFVSIKKLMLLK